VIERVTRLDERRVCGPAGQRLERDGTDELGRGLREDDVDGGAGLREEARQPGRLVAGDASRDSEEDPTTLQGPDGYSPPRRRGTMR
jgi:hypothetical protein